MKNRKKKFDFLKNPYFSAICRIFEVQIAQYPGSKIVFAPEPMQQERLLRWFSSAFGNFKTRLKKKNNVSK